MCGNYKNTNNKKVAGQIKDHASVKRVRVRYPLKSKYTTPPELRKKVCTANKHKTTEHKNLDVFLLCWIVSDCHA